MALASLFCFPKLHFASDVTKSSAGRVRRQPTRSRLGVEMLEDRMLLTAGTANQFGFLNNPTVNFNTQAIGLTLPPQSSSTAENAVQVVAQPMNVQNPVALATFSNLLAQGQAYGQFRALGVNSQGQGNEFVTATQLFLTGAYGFGSGTWPNRPWVPAAYNLGLANHQFGYPSQSDVGFMSAPPWTHQFNQQPVQNSPLDEEATWEPEDLLIQKADHQHKHDRIDDTGNLLDEKNSPAQEQKSPEQGKPELKRGDPSTEEALFTDAGAVKRAQTDTLISRGNRLFESGDGKEAMPLADRTGIPSSLWLSALAPAPVAALSAGLPEVAASAEGGEAAPAE